MGRKLCLMSRKSLVKIFTQFTSGSQLNTFLLLSLLDFNLPVCKENQTTSVADAAINEFVDEIKPTLDVGDITNEHFQRTTETSSVDDPPSHPLVRTAWNEDVLFFIYI